MNNFKPDDNIIGQMKRYNFEEKDLIANLNNKKFNHMTAAYFYFKYIKKYNIFFY